MAMHDDEETRTPVDKSTWGVGAWQHEPDRVEWDHAGLPCLANRNHYGAWCGYAAVPPGHPLHGKPYEVPDVDVHGGLTYADKCDGDICHVPKPGEPDDVWWFGFDCGHCFDVMPSMPRVHFPDSTYKTLDYVRTEVNRLAEQLAALAPIDPRD